MLTSILITGAFHEDGLADVCDAFGGGWTKEKILEIMKDSRIGTFGVVGLVISLLSKFILTYELTEKSLLFALGGIILSHSLSRVNATGMIFIFNYARADASSKTKPVAKKLSLNSFLVAVLLGLAPLVPFYLEFGPLVFIVIFPLVMLLFYLKGYFNKWIGGYTGDCLGTVQQLSEILVLLFLLGIWKYI